MYIYIYIYQAMEEITLSRLDGNKLFQNAFKRI